MQDRLPKEFVLKGVKTIEEANAYLRDVYIPRHNERFSVPAKEKKSAFIPCIRADLRDILCIQEERVVQNDNTIRYNVLILQIPQNDLRHHYVRTTGIVHLYENKTLSIFYGHLCLGQYDEHGNLKKEKEEPCDKIAA